MSPLPEGVPMDQRRSPWVVLAMLAMVAVPAGVTLNTVSVPGTLHVATANPTPYGYTVSLLLFVVPIAAIGVWLPLRRDMQVPKQAFRWTLGILVPAGFALDFFLAHRFFTFKNSGATLGIGAPALGGPVPIEEYVFYLTGFTAVLMLYVWLDEYWLAAYNVPDYRSAGSKIPRLITFHGESVVVAVVLVVLAILYKKMLSGSPEGFPGYFTFLVTLAFVPSAGFFESARAFINWRAVSLTGFFIILVSLVWEATLAVPYGWWGYQGEAMMGVSIGAWAGLPIEAVGVWIAVTYATVIVFEILKLWLASGKTAKKAFVGR